MLLLITTNVASAVNWWLKPTGCEINEPTRQQLVKWHEEKPRKITEAVNPLNILGLAEVGAAIGIEFLSNSKNARLFSIILGIKGVVLNIIGGTHAYDLVCEAKNKKTIDTSEDLTSTQDLQTVDSEGIKKTPKIIRIHPENESTPSNEVLSEILNTIEASKTGEDSINITEITKKFDKIKIELNNDVILSPIKDILSTLKKARISGDIRKKHYANLFDVGKDLPDEVLIQALVDRDRTLNSWAMLCLLSKELTTQIEDSILEAIKSENPSLIVTLNVFRNLTNDDQSEVSQRAERLYKGFVVKLKTA